MQTHFKKSLRSLCLLMAFLFSIMPIAAKDTTREVSSMAELKTHLASKQPVVIMFYAPWCGACKAMKEPYDKVCELLKKDMLLVRVNAEDEKFKEALDQFAVEAVPTLVIKHVGIMDEQSLASALRGFLKKAPQKIAPPAAKKAPSNGKSAGSKSAQAKPATKKAAPAQKKAPVKQNGRKS